jgi:sulfatase modifying factor 1
MGGRRSCHAADMDSPRRKIRVAPFRMSRTAVTNAQFAAFVAVTGYVTTAEQMGNSFVFYRHLEHPESYAAPSPVTPWWRVVPGACWHAPKGPGSTLEARADHPVVHVSHADARAFCAATGTRLPDESEWEIAARGGIFHGKFPWGNTPDSDEAPRHTVWRGDFPTGSTAGGTVPVTAHGPNPLGFFNMTGNVWEWTADPWGPLPQQRAPKMPLEGAAFALRGGSFLCHASYCERYYVHSRTFNTADSSLGHTGFRSAAATT